MNILVTGGAGFIGSHLCERLVNEKNNVVCIDNLITGNKKNIEKLLNNPLFVFIERDVTDQILYSEFKSLINNKTIDQIYHLASPASPVQYQNHPVETLNVNSFGTYFLLKLAYSEHARFLYTSTSEVYGDPHEHPQKETYWGNVNSFGPRSCYDEAKRYGEAMCYTFLNTYKVDLRLVRIFNTYGPNMEKDDGRVISNFITQCIVNKPITVYGDGSQTRSFCYVSDLVDGLVKTMESDQTCGQVINLGNPEEHTILEIAQTIKKLTLSDSPIINTDLPVDDPVRRCPDISKANALLEWSPKIQLTEGLTKTIEYFKTLLVH